MKKTFTTFLSLASGLAMTASAAGVMDQGTALPGSGAPAEDSYVSSAYRLIMTWDEQPVHFVEGGAKSFTVTDPNGNATVYETIYLENEYADVTEAQTVLFAFDYAYATGEYEVIIPAGIVANEAGDINPAQAIYFNYGWQMTASSFEPEQSTYSYNWWTGETTIPPFYSSEEVADVTVSFGSVMVQTTGWGEITAKKGNENSIDISDLVSIADGKLKLNLSTLEEGTWDISVPEGYLKGYNEENVLYVNNAFSMRYMIVNSYSPITDYTILSPAEGSYYVNALGQMTVFFGGEPFKVAEDAKGKVTYNGETTDVDLSLGYDESRGFVLNVSVGAYEPGLYEITVPAGSIEAGEYTNPEVTAKYYVVQQIYGEYEVSPESNTMVSADEMKRIVITYPSYSEIVPFSDDTSATVLVGDYVDEYELTMGNGIEISGNQIILTPTKPIEQQNYIISIYANNFILDNDYANGYMSFNYTVWDGMKPAIVLEGPGVMSTYEVEIKLTWNDQTVTPTDNLGVKVSYGWMGDELDIPSSALVLEGGKILSLNLSEYLKAFLDEDEWNTDKEMNVTFPAGIVKNEAGLINPEQTISFTLYQIWDGEIVASVYPAEDHIIQVYWEGGVNWISTAWQEPATLYINNGSTDMEIEEGGWGTPDYGFYLTTGYIDDDYEKGRCILVNVGETSGSYTLIMPVASFQIRNDYYLNFTNEYTTISYQIGADGTITVGDISTQVEVMESDGMFRVFNLQGVNVLNTRDINEIRNLAKGLYIVNGKKVIL